MPSPFPGMNPFFEQPGYWQDFHLEFLSALRRQLVPQLGSAFFVQLEEHLYVHDLPPEPRRAIGRADVSISGSAVRSAGLAAVGMLEAPAVLELPRNEVERVPYLEVRDRQGRELLTVIELLSPSNKKRGENHEQYPAKRRELLRSPTHLVEIDLLRRGRTMPPDDRPRCDYSVLVSRAERRPAVDFWPIQLRERLPVVPISLRPDVVEARVELQEVLHRNFDGPGYESFIDSGAPQPPLSGEQADWARQFVPGNA
ncbi:DUF4058 family protein [Isosphaeraceae bacterium EP7]